MLSECDRGGSAGVKARREGDGVGLGGLLCIFSVCAHTPPVAVVLKALLCVVCELVGGRFAAITPQFCLIISVFEISSSVANETRILDGKDVFLKKNMEIGLRVI